MKADPPTSYRSLKTLERDVIACERCSRLRSWCEQVAREKVKRFKDWDYWGRPIPGFGDPGARLLIVGLAPAAHGANRTGRMFTGDSSGDWLYEALHRYGFASRPTSVSSDDGLTLRDCFISAAARCAPPDNKPLPAELDNCRPWLEGEIVLLAKVRVVVVLGRIAHEAWLKAAGWWTTLPARERPAFGHRISTVMPDGVRLITSFHPSRQNTNTGKLTREAWHAVFSDARTAVAVKSPRS